jgi:hypothetical protein
MTYELEQAWEGFYVMRGGTNWASVEGHADEWAALATWLKNPDTRGCGFKRCAVYQKGPNIAFYSPRNATGENDHVLMTAQEAKEFASEIVQVLVLHGEVCAFENFDPTI